MDRFLKVLIEDAAVREDFLQQTTPEGAYLVAKPYLDGMPMEEFVSSLLGIASMMDVSQSKDISEAELSTVSGGVQKRKLTFGEAMATLNEHF